MRVLHFSMACLVLGLASPALAQERGYDAPPSEGSGGKVTASRRGGGGGGRKPDILRPSTKPWWIVGGAGPDLYDLNIGGAPPPGVRGRDFIARVIVAADFGYHLSGGGDGAAIGGTIEQTFGSSLYTFNPAFKFWWDIEIADMAIYVAPFAKAGYVLGTAGGTLAHGFNLGAGAEGRVVLNDQWMLFARPFQGDLIIGDFYGDTVTLNVSFLIGGGATF
ncbi:MAG: hypothetical protein R3B72_25135 [Polyangiaceae bacterium]